MTAFSLFFSSIARLLTNPEYLLLMAAFVALGILLGALPGISVNMSLILALPLTYSMDTETAMDEPVPGTLSAIAEIRPPLIAPMLHDSSTTIAVSVSML